MPVSAVWQQPGVTVIDVEDIDSLARIAVHYERSILHERAEYGDAFWVCDESGQFRYAVLDPLWQSPSADARWEPEPEPELAGPQPLEASGWAPSAAAPPQDFAAEDLRPSLPAETLQFGAASPSALAHG